MPRPPFRFHDGASKTNHWARIQETALHVTDESVSLSAARFSHLGSEGPVASFPGGEGGPWLQWPLSGRRSCAAVAASRAQGLTAELPLLAS